MNGTPTAPELLEAARQGDNRACEQVLEENAGLIWSIVRRYYGRGVDPEDLYQLGCLGFLKAVQGFDFDYGTCFSTYAVPKIAGEIRRFLRDDGAVKVGRTMREQAQTLYTIRERLRQELGLSATAFKYAVMAASGVENKDICRLFSVSEDSVKSSLKRTFAALGVKNRRGLIGKIPTIK
mgnify:CR=1 FL=1